MQTELGVELVGQALEKDRSLPLAIAVDAFAFNAGMRTAGPITRNGFVEVGDPPRRGTTVACVWFVRSIGKCGYLFSLCQIWSGSAEDMVSVV